MRRAPTRQPARVGNLCGGPATPRPTRQPARGGPSSGCPCTRASQRAEEPRAGRRAPYAPTSAWEVLRTCRESPVAQFTLPGRARAGMNSIGRLAQTARPFTRWRVPCAADGPQPPALRRWRVPCAADRATTFARRDGTSATPVTGPRPLLHPLARPLRIDGPDPPFTPLARPMRNGGIVCDRRGSRQASGTRTRGPFAL